MGVTKIASPCGSWFDPSTFAIAPQLVGRELSAMPDKGLSLHPAVVDLLNKRKKMMESEDSR
jgi:hypothetical protein